MRATSPRADGAFLYYTCIWGIYHLVNTLYTYKRNKERGGYFKDSTSSISSTSAGGYLHGREGYGCLTDDSADIVFLFLLLAAGARVVDEVFEFCVDFVVAPKLRVRLGLDFFFIIFYLAPLRFINSSISL